MTFTLADITYRVAREVMNVREGTATGGSTTTIVDTNNRKEPDDYWNGGTAWIINDSAGAGAAPQGEYSVISDFVNSTSTITLRTTLTTAIATGDRYALCNKLVPLDIFEQSVNRALQDMGRIPVTDITTLDTASQQTEYSIPIEANLDLRQVWIETNKNDADDNRWAMQYNWYVQKTATGTQDLLILPYQWQAGYDIKIVYADYHPEVYSASSQIDESIPIERILYKAAWHVLDYLVDRDDKYRDDLDRYEKIATKYEMEMPVRIPPRTGRIVRAYRGPIVDEGGPDKVVL